MEGLSEYAAAGSICNGNAEEYRNLGKSKKERKREKLGMIDAEVQTNQTITTNIIQKNIA